MKIIKLSVEKFIEMKIEKQIKYMNTLEIKLGKTVTSKERYMDISGYEQLYYINYLEELCVK